MHAFIHVCVCLHTCTCVFARGGAFLCVHVFLRTWVCAYK